MELLGISGIGPKKINVLWKELQIEGPDQLLMACRHGRLAGTKGFGLKTQETILQSLDFAIGQRGKVLYAKAEPLADSLLNLLRTALPGQKIALTGDMRRKMEVIDLVEIVIDSQDADAASNILQNESSVYIDEQTSGPFSLRGMFKTKNLKWQIHFARPIDFTGKLMLSTGSERHMAAIAYDGKSLRQYLLENKIESEASAYAQFGMPYIEPELREGTFETSFSETNRPPDLLKVSELKGAFHNHSHYSDGQDSLRQMAQACIDRGYHYLGMSDHSQSAIYAQGLQEYEILKQHKEIDELNKELAPFRIFKGIESDILNDGSLDYSPEVLASFDFIVASIHGNLSMDIDKATRRLIKAIENPFTTFLGHPTGRLLLKRPGYAINHKIVIDACAAHGVIMEINANPKRLDVDWRWVNYALSRGVVLSINPDAHLTKGLDDMRYGVLTGRKGGLSKEKTFNTWSLEMVEQYLLDRKRRWK